MKEMETEKIEIRDKQIEEFYKDKKLKRERADSEMEEKWENERKERRMLEQERK